MWSLGISIIRLLLGSDFNFEKYPLQVENHIQVIDGLALVESNDFKCFSESVRRVIKNCLDMYVLIF